MKKDHDRNLQGLEVLGAFAAVIVAVTCILYLFDVIQNQWVLNFILVLSVLMHLAYLLLGFLKEKRTLCYWAGGLLLVYFYLLFYFNS